MISDLHLQSDTQFAHEASPVTLDQRRGIGAFYTPSSVANVLCDWAIRSGNDTILEPSFGGCTFLESSLRRLRQLGEDFAQNLYGCDIDPRAFEFLNRKLDGLCADNFDLCDFLKWEGEKIPGRLVDAVIGNPPYVRYSRLDKAGKKSVHDWEVKYKTRLSRLASLWAYFTYHALNFIKEGGRMAWVLPVSLMTSRYAEEIRIIFATKFRRTAYFTLAERIFLTEGTEERALIVLAEGFSNSLIDGEVQALNVESVSELAEVVENWRKNDSPVAQQDGFDSLTKLNSRQINLGGSEEGLHLLGDIATVRIGVVSGNSKFFIRPLRDWYAEGIERSHLRYIAPKSYWLTGVNLSEVDKMAHEYDNAPCFAFAPPLKPRAKSLVSYMKKYEEADIKSNATFKKRENWFRFLEDQKPDAFMAFMTHFGPRLILNEVGADATNSLYRVEFIDKSRIFQKLAIVSFQTSFTQLAAERLGRALGSGALKLEPRHAKLLPIYLPKRSKKDVEAAFDFINKAMRDGKIDEVRARADSLIFDDSLVIKKNAEKLGGLLAKARHHRRRNNL